ncbi:MAG: Omp28-related outer membrane protein [Bacteroidetes bacterium]|nr:Omp28-related outer membrane protein [Bacteroidota bacterium]
MKTFLLSSLAILFCGFFTVTTAQTIVGTYPANKNVVLENFTGVKCTGCHMGHMELEKIIKNYPERVYVIGYHPSNTSFTIPYSTDQDLRRNYPDAFFSTSYAGSAFMPGCFINRETWSNGNKMQFLSLWDSHTYTLLQQPSPLNIGLSSTYDASAQTLTVLVEVYYTSTVTANNSLYVHILEDSINTYQANYGPNHNHMHVFMEDLTGQWGDPITGSTTQGSLFTTTYVFDLTTAQDPITIANASVIAYVIEDNSTEVYTGVAVGADGGLTVGIPEVPLKSLNVNIYPNPFTSNAVMTYGLTENADVSILLFNVLGETVLSENLGSHSPGGYSFDINKNELGLSEGMYFIRIDAGDQTMTRKLIIE